MALYEDILNQVISKEEWRNQLLQLRQAIPLQRKKQASEMACQFLYDHSKQAPLVLSFTGFGSEIDLLSLNQQLASERRLLLPRVVNQALHLYLVSHLDDLELHVWGMQEPKPSVCPEIHTHAATLALIPGLGFDLKTHHRLGYGKGFYDRLLKPLDALQTWGIGYTEQAVIDLNYDEKDVPLTEILLF